MVQNQTLDRTLTLLQFHDENPDVGISNILYDVGDGGSPDRSACRHLLAFRLSILRRQLYNTTLKKMRYARSGMRMEGRFSAWHKTILDNKD